MSAISCIVFKLYLLSHIKEGDSLALIIFRDATLIDGKGGDPLSPATIVVEDGVIREITVGKFKMTIPADAMIVNCYGKTLLPGLIDAHIHVGLFDGDENEQPRQNHPSMLIIKALKVMEDTLYQGFTTCRDAGGVDAGFREAQKLGLIKGPRLKVSGRSLSMTGGHGDCRLSTDRRNPYDEILGCSVICDGVSEVRKAAREELRRGADHIKVMAGGGCSSPTDEPDACQYSLEELEAIAYEANSAGKYALAHCYSNRSVQNCVKAGIKSIEHGNFMDRETAKLLHDADCWYVPTLTTYEVMTRKGEEFGIPDYFLRKMKMVYETAIEAVTNAYHEGVVIGSGSDVIGPAQPYKAMELELKARVLGPMGAIVSATRVNSAILCMDDKVGTIEPGKLADLIVVDGDPLKEISLLQDRSRICIIMQGGIFIKNIIN